MVLTTRDNSHFHFKTDRRPFSHGCIFAIPDFSICCCWRVQGIRLVFGNILFNIESSHSELFCKKRCSEKFCKIYRKASYRRILFNKVEHHFLWNTYIPINSCLFNMSIQSKYLLHFNLSI